MGDNLLCLQARKIALSCCLIGTERAYPTTWANIERIADSYGRKLTGKVAVQTCRYTPDTGIVRELKDGDNEFPHKVYMVVVSSLPPGAPKAEDTPLGKIITDFTVGSESL